jgi:hypothetical protein
MRPITILSVAALTLTSTSALSQGIGSVAEIAGRWRQAQFEAGEGTQKELQIDGRSITITRREISAFQSSTGPAETFALERSSESSVLRFSTGSGKCVVKVLRLSTGATDWNRISGPASCPTGRYMRM